MIDETINNHYNSIFFHKTLNTKIKTEIIYATYLDNIINDKSISAGGRHHENNDCNYLTADIFLRGALGTGSPKTKKYTTNHYSK